MGKKFEGGVSAVNTHIVFLCRNLTTAEKHINLSTITVKNVLRMTESRYQVFKVKNIL